MNRLLFEGHAVQVKVTMGPTCGKDARFDFVSISVSGRNLTKLW